MYKCIKEHWSFVYKINNLVIPLERKIEKDSIWMKVIGDVGGGDYNIRLRSENGILVLDMTEEEFEEYFVSM